MEKTKNRAGLRALEQAIGIHLAAAAADRRHWTYAKHELEMVRRRAIELGVSFPEDFGLQIAETSTFGSVRLVEK